MKREDFENMILVKKNKALLDYAVAGGGPLMVDIFWDKRTYCAYQVGFDQGIYRSAPDEGGVVQAYGNWTRLEG
jgi:hypothetical protein